MTSQNLSTPDKDPLFKVKTAVVEQGSEIIRDASKTQLALARAARLAQEIEIATVAEQKAHEAEVVAAGNYIELLLGGLATSDPAYKAACERLGIRFDEDESIVTKIDQGFEEKLRIRTESMQFNDGSVMPIRITNALKREGCHEVRDIVMLGLNGFMDIRNIGDQAVKQLQDWMEENGLADQWKTSNGSAEQAAELYDSLDDVIIAVTSMARHIYNIGRSQFHVTSLSVYESLGRLLQLPDQDWDTFIQRIQDISRSGKIPDGETIGIFTLKQGFNGGGSNSSQADDLIKRVRSFRDAMAKYAADFKQAKAK